MASVDVSIRGAGIFGLSIAWACARRGARVEVFDPLGVGAGASGGIVGALAPHVPENWNPKKQFQLESLLMAEAFWAEIAGASGRDPGYRRLGRVQPLLDQRAADLARQRCTSSEDLWRGRADWTVTDDAQGWSLESPTGLFVFDTLSAQIHPRNACHALAGALGDIVVGDPSTQAGAVVWATGAAGLQDLSERFETSFGNGVKGQAALLDVSMVGLPQVFVDGVHVIPHADGTVAVGSTTERNYTSATTTDALLDAVIEKVRVLVPALSDAPILERWAGLRPRARSRAPVLGAWPERPGHYIANGGFKIGFGMAPKIAEVMADLILEGTDRIPVGFRVEDNS